MSRRRHLHVVTIIGLIVIGVGYTLLGSLIRSLGEEQLLSVFDKAGTVLILLLLFFATWVATKSYL